MKTIVKIETSKISSEKDNVVITFISSETKEVIKTVTFVMSKSYKRKEIKYGQVVVYDEEREAYLYLRDKYICDTPLFDSDSIRQSVNDVYEDEDCTISTELPELHGKFYRLTNVEFIKRKPCDPEIHKLFCAGDIAFSISDYYHPDLEDRYISTNEKDIKNLKDKCLEIIDKYVHFWNEVCLVKSVKLTYDIMKTEIEFDIDESLQQLINEFNIEFTPSFRFFDEYLDLYCKFYKDVARCIAKRLGYEITIFVLD